MSKKTPQKQEHSWVQVAMAIGTLQAEIIAGSLRAYDIPVYIDLDNAGSLFPSSAFGNLTGNARIFVPEEYYDYALTLLDDEDPLSLDEPDIHL